jgi:Cys-tRNA(Pro)/Cys-tRNA(Cys) deacylase
MNNVQNDMQACTYLSRLLIPYRIKTFSPDHPFGTSTVAQLLGMDESLIVKTLIFNANNDSGLFMVLTSGDTKLKSSVLKNLVGSKNITLASPEDIVNLTGFKLGSIPPFSWIPTGFRVFIEQKLLAEELVGVGAGQWGVEIVMSPKDLVLVTGAICF